MPSPVGHLLAGLCVYGAVPADRGRVVSQSGLAVAALVSIAPDLDLALNVLTGRNYHQAHSHSVGAALIAGLAVWALSARRRWPHSGRLGLTAGLAWLSHVGLDYLSVDTSPPIGLMALWPLSDDWHKFRWPILLPISRHLEWAAQARNVLAAAWEVVLLGPLLALTWRLRRARSGGLEPARDSV
jgi:inner membrane protein